MIINNESVTMKMAWISILFFFLFACNSGDENSEGDLIEQRITQLNNLNKYGAKPIFQSFVEACNELNDQTKNFSQDRSSENLNVLRQQWIKTGNSFKKCELYNMGDVNTSFIQFRIHRWPIQIKVLKDTLNSSNPVTFDYVSNLGSNLIGLGALEYLLFLAPSDSIISMFQSHPKRLNYLIETTQYLQTKALEMQTEWDRYSPEFVTATESRISGGQNQMINSLLSFVEITVRSRLGRALGEDSGGIKDITLLEAHYSDSSLDFIQNGFEEWKAYFFGDFPGSSNNYGFDDYLNSLDRSALVNSISSAISECDDKMDQLDHLNSDLINRSAQVLELQNAFRNLAILIKTDMASAIGATITVNDSDGD